MFPGVPTMYLLAMDCAGPACSVAVLNGQDAIAWRHETMMRGQSERLVPMIDDVLGDAGIPASSLDRLAVTVGPGAFTGIRIGLASTRAMSLALGIPAQGVTTFDATLGAFVNNGATTSEQPVAVILETKRKDYYAKLFGPDGTSLAPGAALDAAALNSLLAAQAKGGCTLIGDGASRFLEQDADEAIGLVIQDGAGYTAVDVARTALAQHDTEILPPRPLYLRAPDVTPKPAA